MCWFAKKLPYHRDNPLRSPEAPKSVPGVLMFVVSANFIFKIPDPSGIGYAPITYIVACIVGIISFIVSGVVSVVMYLRSKKEK